MRKILILAFFFAQTIAFAQTSAQNTYLKKAEWMYNKVYHLYRTPQFGLFTEFYPTGLNTKLDYFQGEKVDTKVVSYLWPFSGMFSATNVMMRLPNKKNTYKPYLDSMVQGVEMYHDTLRKPFGYQAYPSRFEKVDRYYDDNGLVGIDYVEAYKNTRNKIFLARAKNVFNFILSGWDNVLGGGVFWLEGHQDQKPACSNGKATVLALKLYESTHDTVYLNWGVRFYDWMKNNLRDSSGIYWNDRKTATGEVNKIAYTYNTGTMLQSAVMLYKISRNKQYLKEAQFLAEGSYKYFGRKQNDGRILLNDSPWFTLVLFRGYHDLYDIDHNSKYVDAIIENVDYAWLHARDKSGLVVNDWTGLSSKKENPKWLLDEACMAELFARIAMIKTKN